MRQPGRRAYISRDDIFKLVSQGLGTVAIAKALGITKQSVSYHKARLHIAEKQNPSLQEYLLADVQKDIDARLPYRKIAEKYTISVSVIETALKNGRLRRVLHAAYMDIDEYGAYWNGRPAKSSFRSIMKRRLIRMGRKEICSACDRSEWMGKKIPLEVHHIDGDSTHNLAENLDFLCLNCHALTDTWRARNVKKKREMRLVKKLATVENCENFVGAE